MSDLVERAKSWDRCYPGNLNIERLIDDMTAEITRLRAAVAEAEARGYRRGVEDAAGVVAGGVAGKLGRDLAAAIRTLGERG